jgi:hypothetical protein
VYNSTMPSFVTKTTYQPSLISFAIQQLNASTGAATTANPLWHTLVLCSMLTVLHMHHDNTCRAHLLRGNPQCCWSTDGLPHPANSEVFYAPRMLCSSIAAYLALCRAWQTAQASCMQQLMRMLQSPPGVFCQAACSAHGMRCTQHAL